MNKNPIEVLSIGFSGEDYSFDFATRVYLARPVLGKLNSIAISAARRHLRENTVTEGGIDDPLISALRERDSGREGIYGFQEPMPAREVIGRMLALHGELLASIDPTDAIWVETKLAQNIGNVAGTLEFMSRDSTVVANDRLEILATQLAVDKELLRRALDEDRKASAIRLKADAPTILDFIYTCDPIPGEFEQLSGPVQAMIYQAVDKSLDSSFQNALRTVLRANNRMGDIPFIQAMKKDLKSWNDTMMKVDPDYAARIMGIG